MRARADATSPAGFRTAIAAMVASFALLVRPAPCEARQTGAAPAQGGPLVLLNAQYAVPEGASGSVGVLVPIGPPPTNHDGTTDGTRRGLELEAGGGQHGWHAAAGLATFEHEGALMTIGLGFRGVVTRTFESATKATPQATYVGGEAALVVSVLRVTAGVAHRMTGAAGSHGTIFTWGLGVQVPIGW